MINSILAVIGQILPEPQASLLVGMVFGAKASLPKSFYDSLIATGTVHIVVLSGQNISILTTIISRMTLAFGRRISLMLTVVTMVGFILLVGVQAPVVRAAIMASFSLLAVYFGKQSWSLLGLFWAAVLMLLINPAWFFDLSFQLSFLATLGIILFGGAMKNKSHLNLLNEIKSEFLLILRTSLAAQILTIPLIAFHFGRISLVAPLANVLVGWTVAPIMSLGLLTVAAGVVSLPLGRVVGLFAWVLLSFFIKAIELIVLIPFASIAW